MSDFYSDGFDTGYGRGVSGEREFPVTDGEVYDYRQGMEDGQDCREMDDEFERRGDE